MKITQISVFLGNKKGRLATVTKVLAEQNINIRSLCIAETENYGIVRMLVDSTDKAIAILKNNDFVCDKTDILAVEVPDVPGGLNSILEIFDTNNINIEYAYAFVEKKHSNAIMIFKIDELDKAINIAEKNNITLVSADKIITEL
ncbi:MAG: amino acid-binding protein [Spirochaetes bacterium GWF1_31_7]|nr:MAG: amino acid-binding protein [Spirochaetes bacterium GWE1_32_154]OHD50123.1 MAG: amino acid-binding protein [Spirochaetes bacterium GWE2_31_10]OHD52437.1 MAG: amino acid-binding protein [Spirochaetes bacterium GWF1_31_7]OHD79789.1 MAG: amino acid-binding protein [Spirochaetes bacterium RIFOXYB1_FULL_32_8]HBD96081.1 amino acid-binding protein [Spirochaetia bacterium]